MHSAKSFFSNQDLENAHFIEALGYLMEQSRRKDKHPKCFVIYLQKSGQIQGKLAAKQADFCAN